MNIHSYNGGKMNTKGNNVWGSVEEPSRLAEFFKVLADETRLKILCNLMDGAKCVMHLSERVAMSQSAVSHQLAILKRANLVKVLRDGKKQIYSLADGHVRAVLELVSTHVREDGKLCEGGNCNG